MSSTMKRLSLSVDSNNENPNFLPLFSLVTGLLFHSSSFVGSGVIDMTMFFLSIHLNILVDQPTYI